MSVKLSSIPTYYSTLQLLSSTLGNPIFMTSYFSSLVISLLFASHLFTIGFLFFYSFTHDISANNSLLLHSSVITLLLMISEKSWRNVIVTFLNAWIWILKCDTSIFHILNFSHWTLVKNCLKWKKKKVSIVFWRENENSKVRKCVVNQPTYFWEKMLKKVNFESQYHKFIIARAMLSAHSEILWPVMTTPSVFTRDLNWIGVFQAVFLKLTPSILIRSVAGVFQIGDLTLHFSYFP